jgi:energy-coupling factor transporter ATP-binding protein EcfA2
MPPVGEGDPVNMIPPEVAARAAQFSGREWVLNEIDTWLKTGSEQFFLITGEPGSGKSTLSAWLAGIGPLPASSAIGNKLENVRRKWTAVHFCVAEDRAGSINPTRFAESVALQLSQSLPSFRDALRKRLAPDVHIEQSAEVVTGRMIGAYLELYINSDPADVYNRLVREPLESVAMDQPGTDVCILVDALDEANTYRRPDNIVRLLSGSGDFPDCVRFLLTSRNDRKVTDRFRQYRKIDLSDARRSTEADSDITAYCKLRLNDPALRSKTEIQRDKLGIMKNLVRSATGNFLYAKFVLDEIASGKRSSTEIPATPEGLYALYRRYMNRLIPEMVETGDSTRWQKEYRPLLGLLSAAAPAAPDELLPKWLGYAGGQTAILLDDVSQLVEHEEGGWRLYHRSVSEFLNEREYEENGDRIFNPYYTPVGESHKRLADYYLERSKEGWEKLDRYGLQHLSAHLFELRDVEEYRRALYHLVSASLMKLKHDRLHTHRSFATDVALAIETADKEQSTNWPELARCCLAYSRLATSKVPPDAVKCLAILGQSERALDLARLVPIPSERVALYVRVAEGLLDAGDAETARHVVTEALQLKDDEIPSHYNSNLQELLVLALIRLKRFDHAQEVLSRVPDYRQSELRTKLALALVDAGLSEKALELARSSKDPRLESAIQTALTRAEGGGPSPPGNFEREPERDHIQSLIDRHEFGSALEAAENLGEAWKRQAKISAIAKAASIAGEFGKLIELVTTITKPDRRTEALAEALAAQTQTSGVRAALKSAESLSKPERDQVMEAWVSELISNRQLDDALKVVNAYAPPASEDLRTKIANEMIRNEECDRALAIADMVTGYRCSDIYWGVAHFMFSAGQNSRAAEIAHRAMEQTEKNDRYPRELAVAIEIFSKAGDESGRDRAIARATEGFEGKLATYPHEATALLRGLASAGRIKSALEVANKLGNNEASARAWSELVPWLVKSGNQQQAAELAGKIQSLAGSATDSRQLDRIRRAGALAFASLGDVVGMRAMLDAIEGYTKYEAFAASVTALVEASEFAAAAELAENSAEVEIRDAALSALAVALARAGRLKEAGKALSRIAHLRAETLRDAIVPTSSNRDRKSGVEVLLEGMPTYWATKGLAVAALRLIHTSRFDEAAQLVGTVENPLRDQVRERVADRLAKSHRFADAKQWASRIAEGWSRSRALGRLLSAAAITEGAPSALSLAAELSRTDIIDAIKNSLETLVKADNLDSASELLTKLDSSDRPPVLAEYVRRLTESGRMERAQDVANQIMAGEARDNAFEHLARAASEGGDVRAALQYASKIENVYAKDHSLNDVVANLTKRAHSAALAVAAQISQPHSRAAALASIALSFARRADTARAEEIVEECLRIAEMGERDGGELVDLYDIGYRLAELNHPTTASRIATALPSNRWTRPALLRRIMMRLLRDGKSEAALELADRAVEAASQVESERDRSWVTANLVPLLVAAGASGPLHRALDSADDPSRDPYFRAELLARTSAAMAGWNDVQPGAETDSKLGLKIVQWNRRCRAKVRALHFALKSYRIARAVQDPEKLASVLYQISVALSSVGTRWIGLWVAHRTRLLALQVPAERGSVKALALASLAYARLKKPKESRLLLDQALDRVTLEDQDKQSSDFSAMVETLAASADVGQMEAAVSVARGFAKKNGAINELARLCRQLVQAGKGDLALLPAQAAAELAVAEADNRYAFAEAIDAAACAKDRPSVEIALAGIRAMKNRDTKAIALALAARDLVRRGSALGSEIVNEARGLISSLQNEPPAQAALAGALARMKRPKQAATLLRRSIYHARVISPQAVFSTLRQGSEMLVSIDRGATLARCMESALDVREWWS